MVAWFDSWVGGVGLRQQEQKEAGAQFSGRPSWAGSKFMTAMWQPNAKSCVAREPVFQGTDLGSSSVIWEGFGKRLA